MSVYFSSLDKMETRSSRLDPTPNAIWRRNIVNEVLPLTKLLAILERWHMSVSDRNYCLRIARRVIEAFEPLRRLDREWAPRKSDIIHYRDWAEREIRNLDVRILMYEVGEVYERYETLNTETLVREE